MTSDGDSAYTATEIKQMVEFLIDNIFFKFEENFYHFFEFPWQPSSSPLFADLFLYWHDTKFSDNTMRSCYGKLSRLFNLCCRTIDVLIVFNKYVKDNYPNPPS